MAGLAPLLTGRRNRLHLIDRWCLCEYILLDVGIYEVDKVTNDIKRVKAADLIPDSKNANLGTERGLALLDDSLRSLGAGRSILVDKNMRVIAGNKTLERAQDIGLQDVILVPTDGRALVAVVRTDLDLEADPDARRLAIADNRVGEVDLAWSPKVLLDLAEEYGREVVGGLWSETEWRDSVVAKVLAQESAERQAPTPAEASDALQEKWGTQPGQIWAVPSKNAPGRSHFLACLDSSDRSNLLQVAGKIKANLLVTSPPYWVGMEYEEEDTESQIDTFIDRCVQAWTDSVSVDHGRIVINTGTAAIHRIDKTRKTEILLLLDKWQRALRHRGWIMRHLRVWAKTGDLPATIGPGSDVVDQHCEHLATFDHSSSDFEYLGTWWAPAGRQRGQERAESSWAQQGLWADIPGDASAGGAHVAAFPVEIPRRFILLYTKPGEFVLDPFIGSGTTLLAAEMAGRLAIGLDKSPKYLAGALERISDFGLEPALVA